MSSDTQEVLYAVTDRVATVTLNRPEKLNAWTAVMAEQLRAAPGVRQVAAFGNTLHVSGDDATELARAIEPYRRQPYAWREAASSLEDVFIHLMGELKDNART